MMQNAASDAELRVLLLAPTKRDGSITLSVLANSGIGALQCANIDQMVSEIGGGVGSLMIAEECLIDRRADALVASMQDQPPWSDLPVFILARQGTPSIVAVKAVERLGNATLLERPLHAASFVSAVRTALNARKRQYQARDLLAERERANEALRRSQESLELADRRKDEFLAMLAHELRNPLAPLRNSVHILQLTAVGDATVQRVCEMMERQVVHLVRLVDDLLEVSRITRGKVELRLETIDLVVILNGAIETSRPLVEAGSHQLAVELPDRPLYMQGDPIRLSQVFSNLLNNAAKYTNPGGHIILKATREEDQAVVRICDDGIGIPLEVQSQVFDMFMQVDRSTSRAQGGLGIGLTLVRTLVEMHHGKVSVASDGRGCGSEFTVRLPLAPADKKVDAKPSEAAPSITPRHVLVVDDNRDAAASMGMLLKFLGAEVQVVQSGRAALEIIESFRPSMVLLDLGMPGMDGYEVARQIRRRPGGQDILLIALTGWGQDDDRRRTRDAGFNHHLVKPADINTLQTIWTAWKGKKS